MIKSNTALINNHTLHLKQRHWLFGSRELWLDDHNQLTILEKSWLRSEQTTIPLHMVQESPSYSRTFATRWFLYSLFLLALIMLCSVAMVQLKLPILWLVVGAASLATLFTLYRFALHTTNLVIFRHYPSQEQLLYLWKDKPNPAKFRFFVDELDSRIQHLRR